MRLGEATVNHVGEAIIGQQGEVEENAHTGTGRMRAQAGSDDSLCFRSMVSV